MNKKELEKHEKAFEEWSAEYWGINVDPSEVEKMIWLVACEYMSSSFLQKDAVLSNGLIFNKETVESLIKYCFAVERKLDIATEALEKIFKHETSDDKYNNYTDAYFGLVEFSKEALNEIKEQE